MAELLLCTRSYYISFPWDITMLYKSVAETMRLLSIKEPISLLHLPTCHLTPMKLRGPPSRSTRSPHPTNMSTAPTSVSQSLKIAVRQALTLLTRMTCIQWTMMMKLSSIVRILTKNWNLRPKTEYVNLAHFCFRCLTYEQVILKAQSLLIQMENISCMVMALCNAQGIDTIVGPDGRVTCVVSGVSKIDPE